MFKLIFLIYKKVELLKEVTASFRFRFWVSTRLRCKNTYNDERQRELRAELAKNERPKNQEGFVLVFMTVFLLLALILALTFSSSLILLQNKMKTVHQCRVETLSIQKQVKPILEKLLSLNPAAKALRIQKNLVNVQIGIAIATLNVQWLAALQVRRRAIITSQRVLDKTQTGLIAQANFILSTETLKAHYKMNQELQSTVKQQSQWADTYARMLPPKISKLAVRPTDRRMAPTYELKKDFEKHQAVGLFWIQGYEPIGFMKNSGFSKSQVKNQCLATLEENTWLPKIRRDKLY